MERNVGAWHSSSLMIIEIENFSGQVSHNMIVTLPCNELLQKLISLILYAGHSAKQVGYSFRCHFYGDLCLELGIPAFAKGWGLHVPLFNS